MIYKVENSVKIPILTDHSYLNQPILEHIQVPVLSSLSASFTAPSLHLTLVVALGAV